MTRLCVRIGIVCGTAGLVVVAACSAFDFPRAECHGELVDYSSPPQAADRSNCARCLEMQCCDDVGRCAADPACFESFKGAHRHAVDEPFKEQSFIGKLEEQPRKLYKCMRQGCASECGISACQISATVSQFGSGECDHCITASCCEQVNSCYENRRCKLAVECMGRECDAELADAFEAFGDSGPGNQASFTDKLCGPKTKLFIEADAAADSCLERCLRTFTTGAREDPEARCAAVGVFLCSANAGCGAACRERDAGPDGGADAD